MELHSSDKERSWDHSGFFQNPLSLLFAMGVVLVSVYLFLTPYSYLTILVGPALIAVLYLVLVNPAIGLYLLLFLVPFDEFRQLGGETLAFLTISKLLGVLLIAAAAWRLIVRDPQAPRFGSNLWIWFTLFAFVVALSTLLNATYQEGIDYFRQLLTAALTMTMIYGFLGSQSAYERVPLMVSIGVTINGFLALIGALFEISWLTIGTEQSFDLVRGTGGARDPNVFSSTVIFVLPFLAYWLANGRRMSLRLLSGLGLLINAFAVMMTYSRGGALVMGIILFILLFLYATRLKPRQVGLAIVLSVSVAVTGLAMTPTSFWDRILTLVEGVEGQPDRSLSRRASYLVVGEEAFLKAPLLGHGPQTYPDLYAQSDYAALFVDGQTSGGGGYRRRAHNTYLETAVELGFLGLGTLLLLLMAGWRNFTHAVHRFRQAGLQSMVDLTRAYQIAFLSQLLYFFILSQPFAKFVWAMLGMSVVASRLSAHAGDQSPVGGRGRVDSVSGNPPPAIASSERLTGV